MLGNLLRPGYLVRRLGQIRFEKANPDAPWLTPAATRLLDSWLKPTDRGLEWGSGRSTAWIAARVAWVLSVEENLEWHAKVRGMLAERGLLEKVDYRRIPCEHGEQDEPESHPYADVADEVADGSLDFALVDGNIRLLCLSKVLPKLKPGGLLILDNANRYVPNTSLGRAATVHEPRTEPRTPAWAAALARLAPWRAILTTDGIWDTRMWVKPA